MKLRAIFESQARVAAGVPALFIELEGPADQLTREQVVRTIASHGTSQLSDFLLDHSGTVRSSVLVFLEDAMMPPDTPIALREENDIVITSLISGG